MNATAPAFPADLTDKGAVIVATAEWLLNGAQTCEPMPGVTLSVTQNGYIVTHTDATGEVTHANVIDLADYAASMADYIESVTTSQPYEPAPLADWEQALMDNAAEIAEDNRSAYERAADAEIGHDHETAEALEGLAEVLDRAANIARTLAQR